jgi:hypothetical protein
LDMIDVVVEQKNFNQTKCGGRGWRGPRNFEVLKQRIFTKVVKE